MKFVLGLLAGTVGMLLLTSVAGFEFELPKRLPSTVTHAETAEEPGERVDPPNWLVAAAERVTAPVTEAPVVPATIPPGPPPLPEPVLAPAPGLAPEPEPEQAPPIRSVTVAPVTVEEPEEPAELSAPEQHAESAVVWKPFHSEVTATGFARRLSTQLGYPFRTLKEGPGKYHVVFDYNSEQQRETLQKQVTALTGYQSL